MKTRTSLDSEIFFRRRVYAQRLCCQTQDCRQSRSRHLRDMKPQLALNRDLKIRRRRVSTTAAVSWGEWGEVAVVWREKLT